MPSQLVVIGGLGYVGLPLAVLAQEKGWHVVSQDINEEKVTLVNQGISPLADPRLAEDLKKYPIVATLDYAVAGKADVIVITVPTPVTEDKQPDLNPLTSALNGILPYIHAGQTLIVESTVDPGVMDDVVIPLLKKRTDLDINELHLAYCPERINPGDPKWSVRNIPRVLGGYSEAGVVKAKEFYDSILEAPVMVMNNATEAEAVKIMENTFRDVNIAFVNEMAKSFDRLGIDVMNVIAGAATKPFAFLPHYPGTGVGGHCISVDPYYMIKRGNDAGFDHQFLKLAREINDSMPAYTIELLLAALQSIQKSPTEATVALLGLAYKPNVADIRESPALHLRSLLEAQVGALRVYDPFVAAGSTVKTLNEAIAGADAIVLATAHSKFTQNVTAESLKKYGLKIVIDGRNALAADEIAAAGIYYHGIGRARLPH